MQFTEISRANNGNVSTAVFELTVSDQNDRDVFESRLKDKIKRMKIHRSLVDNDFRDLLSPMMSEQFMTTVNDVVGRAGTPVEHSLVPFDVRRSRVTEFMSHLILEDNFGCVFHDVVDKRMNLDFHRADRHVEGIDVTGVQTQGDKLRFVVCEVKATHVETTSPSTVMTDLIKDIDKAHEDHKQRLTREIVDTVSRLGENAITSTEIKNIIQFLTGVLAEKKSGEGYLKRVIFFPFLIKQNTNIPPISPGVEFSGFDEKTYPNSELQGVIWSFNEDLEAFCRKIYDEAIS